MKTNYIVRRYDEKITNRIDFPEVHLTLTAARGFVMDDFMVQSPDAILERMSPEEMSEYYDKSVVDCWGAVQNGDVLHTWEIRRVLVQEQSVEVEETVGA